MLIINEEEKGSILIINSVWVCEGCDDMDYENLDCVNQIILHKIINKGVCAFCGIETVGEKTFKYEFGKTIELVRRSDNGPVSFFDFVD